MTNNPVLIKTEPLNTHADKNNTKLIKNSITSLNDMAPKKIVLASSDFSLSSKLSDD